MLKAVVRELKALDRDEQGADMVEYILVIAAVVLPLMAVLIYFWKDIAKWAGNAWTRAKAGEGTSWEELD